MNSELPSPHTKLYQIIPNQTISRSKGLKVQGSKGSQDPGRNIQRSHHLVATVTLFILCWLPLNILNIAEDFNLPLRTWRLGQFNRHFLDIKTSSQILLLLLLLFSPGINELYYLQHASLWMVQSEYFLPIKVDLWS